MKPNARIKKNILHFIYNVLHYIKIAAMLNKV